MDLDSSERGEATSGARRPYKRIGPAQWDEQRDRIRDLFIEQDMTVENVIRVLREDQGFDVGERQLKRQLKKWGFSKNIPKQEMRAMLTKQQRREDLGTPTGFMRREGDGEFLPVSEERLARFQKRFGLQSSPTSSISSDLPSNILYYTPDNFFRSECSQSMSSSYSGNQNKSARESWSQWKGLRLMRTGRHFMITGQYKELHRIWAAIALMSKEMHGEQHMTTVAAEFMTAVMRAANFPGCPQCIVARILGELSRFFAREKQRFTKGSQSPEASVQLRKNCTVLALFARQARDFLSQQRALQIWEPILGSENPVIKAIHEDIEVRTQRSEGRNLFRELEQACNVEGSFQASLQLSYSSSYPEPIGYLLHLGAGSEHELKLEFEAISNTSSVPSKCNGKQKIIWLRKGRAKALVGVGYSFMGCFEAADRAFQDSERYMQDETSEEMKLHRLLWFLEHKTRTNDLDGAAQMLYEAKGFCKRGKEDSNNTTIFQTLFHDRIRRLDEALSQGRSIDDIDTETQLEGELAQDMIDDPQADINSRDLDRSDTFMLPMLVDSCNEQHSCTDTSSNIQSWRESLLPSNVG